MLETIKKCVENDMPLLLLGKSGWGKTSMVEQVGAELGLEVVKLSLALMLPEDVGGIPAPRGESFEYLLPEWFYARKDKEFILFLDEINQAAPQVLHAIYGLVHERSLHGVRNPKMRVCAAGNLADENPHLTEIMQPLLNRFFVVDFVHNTEAAIEHLNKKLGLNLTEIENSPRDTEQGIIAYRAGLENLAVKKAGLGVIKQLKSAKASGADVLISKIRSGKVADRNGFI